MSLDEDWKHKWRQEDIERSLLISRMFDKQKENVIDFKATKREIRLKRMVMVIDQIFYPLPLRLPRIWAGDMNIHDLRDHVRVTVDTDVQVRFFKNRDSRGYKGKPV